MADNDVIGDYAFNVMDYLFHYADYAPGLITLHHGRDVIYCYDLASLKRELIQIAERACRSKHGAIPFDLEDIALNALEEYTREVQSAGLSDRPRTRTVPRRDRARAG